MIVRYESDGSIVMITQNDQTITRSSPACSRRIGATKSSRNRSPTVRFTRLKRRRCASLRCALLRCVLPRCAAASRLPRALLAFPHWRARS
jgi:hypothetical protein